MGEALKKLRRLAVVFTLLFGCFTPCGLADLQTAPPAGTPPDARQVQTAQRNAKPSPVVKSANIDLAETYERLKRWAEAEKYFQEAAKELEPAARREALLGIERARAAAGAQNQELAGARYYQNADVREKAEELYVAALKSDSENVKKAANDALAELQGALRLKRKFDWVLQGLAYLAFVLGVLSVLVFPWMVWRIARSIELRPFTEVGDHVQGQVAFWLSYVRARIQSIGAPLPFGISPYSAELLFNTALPMFRDELPEPQSELEIGGVKIPLAALIGVFIKPRVRISGGWIAPAAPADGIAFASVSRPSSFGKDRDPMVLTRSINTATLEPDLEAFAYDVYIKAVEAHAS
jgi:tetratricopeptide (TPR) repeat protein